MEIGIDIENNDRFKEINDHFLTRTYTEREIAYAKSKKNASEIFCALWCVKEATVKAFSNKKISFKEIEVLHDDGGKPYITKNTTIKNELEKLAACEIKISISHSKDYSTAVCLIY